MARTIPDFTEFESHMHSAMDQLRAMADEKAGERDIYAVHHLVTEMNKLGRTIYTIKRRYGVA